MSYRAPGAPPFRLLEIVLRSLQPGGAPRIAPDVVNDPLETAPGADW